MLKSHLTVLLISLGGLLCTFSNAADFGVADWGMTAADIKNLESRPNLTPLGEQSYLIYAVSLGAIENTSTRIVYQFENGQLVGGRFIFRANKPLDIQTNIFQYNQITEMLTQQYGPPETNLVLTKNPGITIPQGQYANELASDRLILKSQWQSPSAILKHQLAWHNDKPHHQVYYIPIPKNN